ncbi:hypothetical protein LCGC14_0336200 [marine sediment metagenome]|uniref:Uncharacterized protein n=1 Tax=marine sediment metagenome TaxID=412755 RepID=A0A0F9TF25_9ZZZZ
MNNEEMAERYRKLYAGVVYDAMVFDLGVRETACVMDLAVSRRSGPVTPLVGPAMTCAGCTLATPDEINDTIRLDMLDAMTPGCVQVLAADELAVAHFGEISAMLATKHGAVGAVINGATRDLDAIQQADFSLFCRGSKPQDAYGRWQITEFDVPITVNGILWCSMKINPGQWIFADGDSVLVIPDGKAEAVLVLAEKRAANEDEVRAAILADEEPKDIYARLGRW